MYSGDLNGKEVQKEGIYVYVRLIHVNVWQNQYSIVKQNKVKIIKKIHEFIKKREREMSYNICVSLSS